MYKWLGVGISGFGSSRFAVSGLLRKTPTTDKEISVSIFRVQGLGFKV